jgi:hypothetical protein
MVQERIVNYKSLSAIARKKIDEIKKNKTSNVNNNSNRNTSQQRSAQQSYVQSENDRIEQQKLLAEQAAARQEVEEYNRVVTQQQQTQKNYSTAGYNYSLLSEEQKKKYNIQQLEAEARAKRAREEAFQQARNEDINPGQVERLNRVTEMQKNAPSQKIKEYINTIPLLRRSEATSTKGKIVNYARGVVQETAALPASIPESFFFTGTSAVAVGEGLVRKETRSTTVQAARTSLPKVAQTYNPKTPEGLVNLAATAATTVYGVRSARIQSIAQPPKKATVKGYTQFAQEQVGKRNLNIRASELSQVPKRNIVEVKGKNFNSVSVQEVGSNIVDTTIFKKFGKKDIAIVAKTQEGKTTANVFDIKTGKKITTIKGKATNYNIKMGYDFKTTQTTQAKSKTPIRNTLFNFDTNKKSNVLSQNLSGINIKTGKPRYSLITEDLGRKLNVKTQAKNVTQQVGKGFGFNIFETQTAKLKASQRPAVYEERQFVAIEKNNRLTSPKQRVTQRFVDYAQFRLGKKAKIPTSQTKISFIDGKTILEKPPQLKFSLTRESDVRISGKIDKSIKPSKASLFDKLFINKIGKQRQKKTMSDFSWIKNPKKQATNKELRSFISKTKPTKVKRYATNRVEPTSGFNFNKLKDNLKNSATDTMSSSVGINKQKTITIGETNLKNRNVIEVEAPNVINKPSTFNFITGVRGKTRFFPNLLGSATKSQLKNKQDYKSNVNTIFRSNLINIQGPQSKYKQTQNQNIQQRSLYIPKLRFKTYQTTKPIQEIPKQNSIFNFDSRAPTELKRAGGINLPVLTFGYAENNKYNRNKVNRFAKELDKGIKFFKGGL